MGLYNSAGEVTAEALPDKKLIFYPKTTYEAFILQQKLSDMGCKRPLAEEALYHPADIVYHGLVVDKGVPRLAPGIKDIQKGTICHLRDIHVAGTAQALTPAQLTAAATFNEMAARLAQLEVKVAEIHAEVRPQTLNKPAGLKTCP